MEAAEKRGTESARQQRTPVRNAGVSLWQRRHYGLRAVCIAALGGAFFGLLGPYGSYLNSGPVLRILYWVTCAVMGIGLYAGPLFFLRHIGCMAQGMKFWSGVIGLVCVLSLLQTIMSRDLALSIWPELAHHLPGWWRWYGQVLLIAQPCVVFVIFGLRRGHWVSGKVGETAPAKIAEGASPVMLPIRIADDYPRPETILALQMDDHYIRCHQFDGSKLVHGVFREACCASPAVPECRFIVHGG
ncbi:hypothetical protein [Asaia prunellae]|uniref:hypothetical protein n=1 Tax=Asaia prunellae TaxID=610245 RepID=UPI00047016A7|nr:hypothetical protein [Asaia prunellae]